MREAHITWQGGLKFAVQAPGGHSMVIDSPAGTNEGPSPMDLVLVALAGCTGMDVVSILEKQRQPVTGVEVVVRAERAEEHPRVFTAYTVVYIVHGEGVDRKGVERAVELSETKYCSVGAMLGKAAPIHHTIQLDGE
jgi:putative redox protein